MFDQMISDDEIDRLRRNRPELLPIIDNVDRDKRFVLEFRILQSQRLSRQSIYVPNP